MEQLSNNILLVRPANFGFNIETAVSNAFQQILDISGSDLKNKVAEEFENFALTLQKNNIHVEVANDTSHPIKPDAIFPNNWISFHKDGTVILYPMCTANRRLERRQDILRSLSRKYEVRKVLDLSYFESEEKYLEGTGSIVFDHLNKVAYACLSPRTHKEVLLRLCEAIGYEAFYFTSVDEKGKEVYHTNVMMSIGEDFAVVCLESVKDTGERNRLEEKLKAGGHTIISIDFNQMSHFAGNMLLLKNTDGEKLLVCSQTAFDSLTNQQKNKIAEFAKLLPIPIPTIETIGGGSARCMIAEIFCKVIVHSPAKELELSDQE